MATRVFTNRGQAGNWNDPANWQSGLSADSADTAKITIGANATFAGPISVNNFMLLTTETITFTGPVTAAGVGNCQGMMVCDDATALFAPGSSFMDRGVLQVGVAEVGTFIARGTPVSPTVISTLNGVIGVQAAGNGTVTIDGATWTTTKGIVVGASGTGALNVTHGGYISVGTGFVVGYSTGASGTVTLASGGISVAGSANIGDANPSAPLGHGTLSVASGSSFTTALGLRVGTTGAITLTGGTVSAGTQAGGINDFGRIAGHGTLQARPDAWIMDQGTIDASGGTLAIEGNLGGKGTLAIESGATADVTAKLLNVATVAFMGPNATLELGPGTTANTTLQGFAAGDIIEAAGLDSLVWSASAHTLKLLSAGKTVDVFHMSGTYTPAMFALTQSNGMGVVSLHTS